jgi:hypothetical protein
MKFDKLVKFILEGDFDPNYDTNPMFLKKKEIDDLPRKSSKKLSLNDKSKREFEIKWEGKTYQTHARNRDEAIGNIGQRVSAALGEIKPNITISKLKSSNVKVLDKKWNVSY